MINSIARTAMAALFAACLVACSPDGGPASDSTEIAPGAEAAAPARADSGTARESPPSIARPESATANAPAASSPPVPGRPACARPVTVTYYARGGVPDEFIVTFGGMNGAPADSLIDALGRKHGFTATHRYEGAFSGFSAKLTMAALEAMRCEPRVTRISQVVIGGIGTPPPTSHSGIQPITRQSPAARDQPGRADSRRS